MYDSYDSYHTSREAYKKSKHLNSQIEDLNVTKYKERKTVLHKRTWPLTWPWILGPVYKEIG